MKDAQLKIARIDLLTTRETAGTITLAEQTELDELRGDEVKFGIEPEGAAIQAQIDTLTEPTPSPRRRRSTPKEAIEQKRREKAEVFPLTVLLDTDKGTYQYLNSQSELDEQAGAVLREPERFVIVQGERKSPAVNWK